MPIEGAFDALVAASGKCLEGPPGMGFALIRKIALENCAGNAHSLVLDLHDQWVNMEKTSQSRCTPRSSSSWPRAASRRAARAIDATAKY